MKSETKSKFIFSVRIRPICMPAAELYRSRSYVGEWIFVAGCGRLMEGVKTSNELQCMKLHVLTNLKCKQRVEALSKRDSNEQLGP